MKSLRFLLLNLFLSSHVNAQQNLLFVQMGEICKNDKDEKAQNTLVFFELQNDTALSFDYEGSTPAKPIIVKKPSGYKTYAYGYIFFNGVANEHSPGMMNLLLCDYKSKAPMLYVDRNNNYDFTDDESPLQTPEPYNPNSVLLLTLSRFNDIRSHIVVQLSRNIYHSKPEYKKLLNEYYEIYFPNRKFIGLDFCFKETRRPIKCGVLRSQTDSFRIALYDANSNGLYNDANVDQLLIANLNDSVFDNRNELQTYILTEKKSDFFFEKNGLQYGLISIDASGENVTLATTNDLQNKGIAAGTKVPNLKFYDWKRTQHKLRTYRKKRVYFYLTGPDSKNFSRDTIYMRKIAAEFEKQIVVVGLMNMQKSYELNVFGMYANLNWIAAYKDKYLLRDLQLRGIPSSIYLAKKRKVIQYGLSPEQLYELLSKTK